MDGLREGSVCLCVSTDILEEYEEIIGIKTTFEIAKSVIRTILSLPNLKKVTPTYFLHLVETDPDDNKFVDCAFCGEAELIVTNDAHFSVLKNLYSTEVEREEWSKNFIQFWTKNKLI